MAGTPTPAAEHNLSVNFKSVKFYLGILLIIVSLAAAGAAGFRVADDYVTGCADRGFEQRWSEAIHKAIAEPDGEVSRYVRSQIGTSMTDHEQSYNEDMTEIKERLIRLEVLIVEMGRLK